jgi:hypothetical protein
MNFHRLTAVSPLALCLATTLIFAPFNDRASADDPQPASEAPAGETKEKEAAKEEPKSESETAPAKEGEKEKEVELKKVVVAEKRLELMVPATWSERERQNNIIEKEFLIYEQPLKEGEEPKEDTPVGRLTLSSSGGTVEQNMRRWIGQFRLGRDADGEDAVQQEEIELEGATLHLLDISGTYFDAPRGPLGPKVERTDYRMLGAILEIEDGPLYFVKFYGPQKIVEANAKDFRKMVRAAKIAAEGEAEAEPKATPKADEQKRDN